MRCYPIVTLIPYQIPQVGPHVHSAFLCYMSHRVCLTVFSCQVALQPCARILHVSTSLLDFSEIQYLEWQVAPIRVRISLLLSVRQQITYTVFRFLESLVVSDFLVFYSLCM